jgi:sulfane dehydrogenase subunit SoxC
MDRRKFFRLLGAGGLLSLMKGRAQGAPWTEKTFETLKTLGAPLSEYGTRSPFEEGVVRYISPNLRTRHSGADFAPLEKLEGVITPNGLHF